MSASGEVVRLKWRSLSGKVILVALTADYLELAREECEDADVEQTTALLYMKLAIATTPVPTRRRTRAPEEHVKATSRRHLALLK